MEKNSKIYIAGHNGMVGNAIYQNLKAKGFTNFVFTSFPETDLRDGAMVSRFFETEKPEYIILAAAKVGGIVANNTYRAEFIYDNLLIQSNIIHQAYVHGAKKLLFLGSSCIYPKNAPQPLKENYLLTSTLEYTNEPYAIAKIAGIKTIESYNLQYGTNFISVMPTNLYGPNDNFDLEKSHVLPAMIRKMHLGKLLVNSDMEGIRADFNKRPVEQVTGNHSETEILNKLEKYGIRKHNNKVEIELWGTGTPRREFLYVNDLADACVFLMQKMDFSDILKRDFQVENPVFPLIDTEVRNTHINIGVGYDLTIAELAEKIKNIIGFSGQIIWNHSKPDGTMQKLLDVSKLNSYGWKHSIELDEGIQNVYKNHY